MKTFLTILCLTVVAISSFMPAGPLPLGAFIPKPDLKLADISGNQITLKESIKENGLLVMFSCNSCPVVIENQRRTIEVCRFAGEKKIGVVVLNANEANRADEESLDAMKQYAREQGYAWNYAVDRNSELADAFGANRTPECFLFDKNGKLVYHGAIDDNPQDADRVERKHLQEAITEVSMGKEVSVKKSRSVGCNIKRA
ncbi:MAG TPA: thioredoxin family protein [Flavitalea sp.]|nr:thioredoxin family protein [Flavitalea sp.]